MAQSTDKEAAERPEGAPEPDVREEETQGAEEEVPLVSSVADGGAAPETDDPEELRAQRDEYLANWQRARADYQNLRRRTRADVEAMQQGMIQPLLENLLLVLDNLDMALAAPTTTDESKNLAIGVEMTRTQLLQALERESVARIAEGGTFDPEKHQAVESVPDAEAEPGTVLETVRPGYTWRQGVLRYAQVKVAGEAGAVDGGGPEGIGGTGGPGQG